MEEHLKVMEETAMNLGIEMKHIDATNRGKRTRGIAMRTTAAIAIVNPLKRKRKTNGAGSFFRGSQENLTKID